MRYSLFTLIVIVNLISCNTIKVKNQIQRKNKSYVVELGSIIVESNKLSINPKVTSVSNPEYNIAIPLSVQKINSSETGYKRLKVLSQKFTSKDTVKTTFKNLGLVPIVIQYKDKIKAIENLSSIQNSNVLSYIENKSTSKIVTSVTGLVSLELFEKLEKAEGIFLKKTSKNRTSFLLNNNKNEKELIPLNHDLELLAYRAEYFCWGSNTRKKIVLKDLVENKCLCEKGTSTKALKVKKELYDVKF